MAGLISVNAYNLSPTLAGYQQTFSERGRLYFLPEDLYLIIRDEDARPAVFRPREQRPHRIHIARKELKANLQVYAPREAAAGAVAETEQD